MYSLKAKEYYKIYQGHQQLPYLMPSYSYSILLSNHGQHWAVSPHSYTRWLEGYFLIQFYTLSMDFILWKMKT